MDLKNIRWIDVHTNPRTLSEIDASLNQVRERLYIKDLNDQLNVSLDALICLWSQTNGQRWLAKLFRLPIYIISLPNFYTAGIVHNNAGSIEFILLAIGKYLLRLPFFRDYPALTQ